MNRDALGYGRGEHGRYTGCGGPRVVAALGAMTLSVTALALAHTAEVGLIIRSTNASVGGIAVPEQGPVTPGSTLRTTASGGALVEFSLGTQINLLENTSVSFHSEPGQLVAELSSGTLGAKSVGDDTLIVRTHDLQIEPTNGGKAIYLVATQPDNTAIVSARQGPVLITQRWSSQKYVLAEGYYAKVADVSEGFAATGYPQNIGAVPPPISNRTSTSSERKSLVAAGRSAEVSSSGLSFGQTAGYYPLNSNSPVSLTHSRIDWGRIILGARGVTQSVRVTNTGTTTLAAITVSISGTNSRDFSLSSTSPATNCGGSLAAGASCQINVSFTPQALGTRNASLSFAATGLTGSPLLLTITGVGISSRLTRLLANTPLVFVISVSSGAGIALGVKQAFPEPSGQGSSNSGGSGGNVPVPPFISPSGP
jgi:hypothetical protein